MWINEQKLAGTSVSEAIICEKARLLHADLAKKMRETSAAASEFKASRGWFEKFKKRTGIRSVVRQQVFNIGKNYVKCSFVHFISHLYIFVIVFCM